MTLVDVALQVAWHYLGKPYIWGGDDPEGFDCSGLVIECLKSIGKLPRDGDWTAEGLYQKFKVNSIAEADASAGDLVLWAGADGRMVHVEMVIGSGLAIGASGGGSWATDPKAALEKGAFIKVRPFTSRGGVRKFVRP
jgi:cell wall-associated NlpC family hydrolase